VPEYTELELLYREAQSALKAKDYTRATELLKQILIIDEGYKNASRLLARIVEEKRRRWYNDARTWGTIGFVAILAFGFFYAPLIRRLYTDLPASINTTTSNIPIAALAPTIPATPIKTSLPVPTPIPMTWKRISTGQNFERDMVTSFATDKMDSDVIYAAMRNAGVYKTIDGGLSWRPAHQGLASTQTESLLIDSKSPRILYASTLNGIFKTEDGGENWHKIGKGTSLLMDMQDNSHLYARDGNEIFETRDQGIHWTSIYTLKKGCPNAISSWAIHPANGNMLFVGGGETCAGVYQSSNSGYTWSLIGLEDKPDLNPLAIGLDEKGDFSIYANFSSPLVMAENGIYFSHDKGVTWSQTQAGGAPDGICDILVSDPDYRASIYCAANWLAVTKKKGNSWQNIPGSDSKVYTTIHIDHPNGTDRIIAGGIDISNFDSDVGIFIFTDGSPSWVKKNNGIGSTRSELKIDPTDNAGMYLATDYFTDGGVYDCRLYRSTNGGKDWSSIITADWCGPSFDSTNMLFLLEWNVLQKSRDGGESWLLNFPRIEQYSSDPGSGDFTKYNMDVAGFFSTHNLPGEPQSISANPYTDNMIYTVGNTIYYSTDGGVSWQQSAGSEGSFDARLFYTDQSKLIFSIGRTRQTYSTDNGRSWQSCGEDVNTSRSDSRLALDLQGSHLYLAVPDQGILTSTDNCQSWQVSNDGLGNLFVNSLASDPNNSDMVYAGTDGGAYISSDKSKTWTQVNEGLLGATVVYSIVVDKDSNVYASTPYGVFKLEGK
jgi:photosystem II stability/assembly factor-like uncharacterized protein